MAFLWLRLGLKFTCPPGGVLPYKGLMGTCAQSGYVYQNFCLKQGIDFYHYVLNRVSKIGQFLT